jgi:hypothetical protein
LAGAFQKPSPATPTQEIARGVPNPGKLSNADDTIIPTLVVVDDAFLAATPDAQDNGTQHSPEDQPQNTYVKTEQS